MIPVWAHAMGKPAASAIIKKQPADFYVEERFGFDRSGQGEFLYLELEKTALNTHDVVTILSKQFSLSNRLISYSGLKDKRAVTRQWFSMHLAGRSDPDLEQLKHPNLKIISAVRHHKKLKRGTHRSNAFRIRLRQFEGNAKRCIERLDRMHVEGVPNYFGEQRFGRGGENLQSALSSYQSGHFPRNRHLRGLYHSAARSFLFNQTLSNRVVDGCWNQALDGELFILDGSKSWFGPEPFNVQLRQRLSDGDIHPSAALWGAGTPKSEATSLEYDTSVQEYPVFQKGMESAGMKQERRATRLIPKNLNYSLESNSIVLEFELQTGQFATAVIRELVNWN